MIAPAGFGAAFGLIGVIWEIAGLGVPRSNLSNGIGVGALAAAVGGGLSAALVCLLVGSAVAALLNPPVVRRPAAAMLATTGAVVLALAWNGSPANAAVRSFGYGAEEHTWPVGVTLASALGVAVVAWVISVQVAARRAG